MKISLIFLALSLSSHSLAGISQTAKINDWHTLVLDPETKAKVEKTERWLAEQKIIKPQPPDKLILPLIEKYGLRMAAATPWGEYFYMSYIAEISIEKGVDYATVFYLGVGKQQYKPVLRVEHGDMWPETSHPFDDRIVLVLRSGHYFDIQVYSDHSHTAPLSKIFDKFSWGAPEIIGNSLILYESEGKDSPVSIYDWKEANYELGRKTARKDRYRALRP